MHRSCIATFVLSLTLLSVRSADAAIITFNYAGQWSFNDPMQDAPDFWATMASVGIVPGTPVSWSLTINSSVLDENADPNIGLYSAILGSTIRVGSLNLATGPAKLSVTSAGPEFFWVGNMGPPVGGYAPQYFQLHAFGGWSLPSDALMPALNAIGVGPGVSAMTLGFNNPPNLGSAQYQANATWRRVSVTTVPMPGTLPLATAGIVALLFSRRWARTLR
jgi:hypothetical protein